MTKLANLAEAKKRLKAKEEKIRVVSSLQEALEEIERLELEVNAIKKLKQARNIHKINPRLGENKSEATAFALATDWHLGARIKPEQVNYLNAFDASIGKKRVETLFRNIVSLTDKERQNVKISELVLFLGGDLIDGNLHMDTALSNEIAQPIEQAVFAQGLVESGLDFLLNHGGFKHITVVCCDGNHGRITQKQHWNSRQGNSLEWYMYYNLARRYQIPELTWRMVHGLHEYLNVYDKLIRFHHGDTIGFGGINGPYTYLNRKLGEWDRAIRADYSCQGHLHSYIPGSRRWVINGSLIGYSPYAQALAGENNPPIQAFFLMDKKRGLTVQIPILL